MGATITLTEGNDTWVGDPGNEDVDALGGNDTLSGLGGDDVLLGNDGNDALDGGDGNDYLEGGAGDDSLFGGAGNDSLQGSGGVDMMEGGAGDDTYTVDNAGDNIIENSAAGTDTVRVEGSDFTVVLSDWLERVEFGETAATVVVFGNDMDNYMLGNANTSSLDGAAGDDTLDGAGGNDFVDGGAGNDSVLGGGGDDRLSGGEGDDTLIGGTGFDSLVGGTGNDVYYVLNEEDNVEEFEGEGTDTMVSLGGNQSLYDHVENLIGGASGQILAGNGLDNLLYTGYTDSSLYGHDGNDRLVAIGANVTLDGGGGDDTYELYNPAWGVVENSGAEFGNDTMVVAFDAILADNVENLRLMEFPVAFNGTGNALANTLTGNNLGNRLLGLAGDDTLHGVAGNDTLRGGDGNDLMVGGAGIDRLSGGDGYDLFRFDAPLRAGNADVITDFNWSGNDHFQLENSVFKGLSAGNLGKAAFAAGKAAKDVDDRVIYDKATGNLYYDADGTGAKAKVLFASVEAGTLLDAGDFLVT